MLIANMKYTKTWQSVVLSLTVILVWCWVYGRMSWLAWQTPLSYSGDVWLGLGFAKAFMDGDIFPVMYKSVAQLGAPFSANWNDYLISEELIFATIGWLGKVTGLFLAANVLLLLAHLLAALSFWFVGRELKYRAEFVFAGSILFAFSHYIFARGLGHLVLSYYWHLPLILLVSWWTYSSQLIAIYSRKWIITIAVAIITGLLNPYYTWMFLQFIGFSFLLHFVRKQYELMKLPLLLIVVTAVSFVVMNADTFSYSWLHGKNIEAVNRNLAALEVYGLKIPELVFPPAYHAWKRWAEFGQSHYFAPTLIKGEMGSPYLGLVGLVGFAWLAGLALYRLLQGKAQGIPVHAWQTLWILLYSLIGGINLLLGSFGLILFRGTNRYSIVILTLVLLFLVRQLSRNCPEKWILPVAFCITALGLWDQLPPRVTSAQIQQVSERVQADRDFAKSLESKLSKGAMVFQLPVAAFPEIPPIVQMADYEHFRPYLFTQNLHYSYGTNKGRGDADWQVRVAKLPPPEMIRKLESHGFGAIMINRKGYLDAGKSLIDSLTADGKLVITENKDLVAFRLQPSILPVAIESEPVFALGWSVDEGTHRWSESSHTKIMFTNNDKLPRSFVLGFKLAALTPRIVRVSFNGVNVGVIDMAIPGREVQFPLTRIMLVPGINTLSFDTDTNPVSPNTGDNRMLSFKISDFQYNSDGI